MLGNDFARIVEICLDRLDRGEDLPSVLAEYPVYATRLKPLLLVAMASRAMDPPAANQTARRLGRNQMLAEMDQMGASDYYHQQMGYSRFKTWFLKLNNASRARSLVQGPPTYRLVMIALLVVFGIGMFTISVSASGFPKGTLSGLASDVRYVLGLESLGSKDQDSIFISPVSFFNSEDLFLGGNRAAKVAFLLNLPAEEEKFGESFSYQYQNKSAGTGSGGTAAADDGDQGRDNAPGQQENPGLDTAPGQQIGDNELNPPGVQDTPGIAIAPGLVDNPGIANAPGLQDEKDKDKEEKKDKKDKEDKDKEDQADQGEENPQE